MNDVSNQKDDQAKKLRDIFNSTTEKNTEQLVTSQKRETRKRDDVLNLPPRGKVHKKKKRTHLKLSKPFVRLIIVILVLVLTVVVSYYTFGEDFKYIL